MVWDKKHKQVILPATSWVVNLCYSIQFIYSQIWLWKRQYLPRHESHRTWLERRWVFRGF